MNMFNQAQDGRSISHIKWKGWQNLSKYKTPNSYTHSFLSTTKPLGDNPAGHGFVLRNLVKNFRKVFAGGESEILILVVEGGGEGGERGEGHIISK